MTKILIDEALVRQALDALEEATPHLPVHTDWHFESIAALRQALEQPAQQEPVAWWDPKLGVFDEKHFDQLQPLYLHPPAQPLTDANKQFNAAINFAIDQGIEAAVFLAAWREGDTAEWPEFDSYIAAHGITKGN